MQRRVTDDSFECFTGVLSSEEADVTARLAPLSSDHMVLWRPICFVALVSHIFLHRVPRKPNNNKVSVIWAVCRAFSTLAQKSAARWGSCWGLRLAVSHSGRQKTSVNCSRVCSALCLHYYLLLACHRRAIILTSIKGLKTKVRDRSNSTVLTTSLLFVSSYFTHSRESFPYSLDLFHVSTWEGAHGKYLGRGGSFKKKKLERWLHEHSVHIILKGTINEPVV